jgi:catalase
VRKVKQLDEDNETETSMPLSTDEKTLAVSRDAIAAFDKVDGGVHPGFRPAHAKGILLTGTFTPWSEAASLTRAPHIQRSSTPVTVRLSDFAGVPNIPDNDTNASPRGCVIRFHLDEHVHTDIVAHSVDCFPARTAEEFVAFLNALIATDFKGPAPKCNRAVSGRPSRGAGICAGAQAVSCQLRERVLLRRVGLQIY